MPRNAGHRRAGRACKELSRNQQVVKVRGRTAAGLHKGTYKRGIRWKRHCLSRSWHYRSTRHSCSCGLGHCGASRRGPGNIRRSGLRDRRSSGERTHAARHRPASPRRSVIARRHSRPVNWATTGASDNEGAEVVVQRQRLRKNWALKRCGELPGLDHLFSRAGRRAIRDMDACRRVVRVAVAEQIPVEIDSFFSRYARDAKLGLEECVYRDPASQMASGGPTDHQGS